MARRSPPEIKIEANRWLTTYADLMNNLLVMFILLYAISVIDLSKYEKIAMSFVNTFGGGVQSSETSTNVGNITIDDLTLEQIDALMQKTPDPNGVVTSSPEPDATEPAPSPTPTVDPNVLDEEGENEYDELVARISALLKEHGYDKHIIVEKIGDYIYLRFREGILFLPDQAVMKKGAEPVLSNISEVIMDSYDLISNIDISGHTARIPYDLPSKDNLFSWELSTNRALTVLEYLVRQCDMPQEKLSVTGYSSNQLYVEGDSEEYWAQNRRVEIRLSRAKNQTSSQAKAPQRSTSS